MYCQRTQNPDNMKKEPKNLRELGSLLEKENAPLTAWLKRGLVPRSELSPLKMTCGNEKKFNRVKDANGSVYEWVGIGWCLLNHKEPCELTIF